MADAQFRTMQAAVLEQEIAGIDIITGGEAHRRTHNRHAPPNAMLNHFWQKIPALQGMTRPKPITKYDPNVTHPAVTCTGPISNSTDLGLVDEFRTVSEFARRPVKITMTGPLFLTAVTYDEHYNDPKRMMLDAAKLLNNNFRRLAEAGCKHIQIDEPYLTPPSDDEVRDAVEAINLAIGGPAAKMSMSRCTFARATMRSAPITMGRSAIGISTRAGTRPISICQIRCHSYLDRARPGRRNSKGLLGNRQLGVGAVDVQAPNVETGTLVAARIRAHPWLAPEQTIITSTCGFNHLPRHIALGKMRAMVEAKAILSAD